METNDTANEARRAASDARRPTLSDLHSLQVDHRARVFHRQIRDSGSEAGDGAVGRQQHAVVSRRDVIGRRRTCGRSPRMAVGFRWTIGRSRRAVVPSAREFGDRVRIGIRSRRALAHSPRPEVNPARARAKSMGSEGDPSPHRRDPSMLDATSVITNLRSSRLNAESALQNVSSTGQNVSSTPVCASRATNEARSPGMLIGSAPIAMDRADDVLNSTPTRRVVIPARGGSPRPSVARLNRFLDISSVRADSCARRRCSP